MTDALKIIGANGNRKKNDFYPTPPECTVALLDFLKGRFLLRGSDTIWEPACGDNAMVNVMRQKGYSVIATDIIHGQDYLTWTQPHSYDWIITNPPFCLAQEFIAKSIGKNKPFALLLKSQYWHSARRYSLFKDCQPTFVLPLLWRPDFEGKGASTLDMIWCVWIGRSQITYYIPLEKPTKGKDRLII